MLGLESLRDGTSTEKAVGMDNRASHLLASRSHAFPPRRPGSARPFFCAIYNGEDLSHYVPTSIKLLDGLFACLKLGESSVTSMLACR